MQRVDFLGASGVGKSTFYKELLNNRTKSAVWMTPIEAKTKIAYQYIRQNGGSVKEYLFRAMLKRALCKRLHPLLVRNILFNQQQESIWREKDRYAQFFETALKGATIKENPCLRLLRIVWFYEALNDVLFIENSKLSGLVLFNDSLSQRFNIILSSSQGYCKTLAFDYFKNIPLPFGLIYCKLNEDKTINRIIKRSTIKTIFAHRDIEFEVLFKNIQLQLSIAEIGADVLKSRGVKVFEIDMENLPENNVKLITDALLLN